MIKIKIPNNNVIERKYVIDVLLSYLTDFKYVLEIDHNQNDYVISYKEKNIIIKDYFFNRFKEPLTYLDESNIPKTVQFLKKNNYSTETEIPIIYGKDKIAETENTITCYIDIFACTFFMLTRWEEIVLKSKKDKLGRFDENESLSVKLDFYRRPIVNEYLALLKGMMSATYIPYKFDRKYKLKITHDVDQLYRYDGFLKCIKAMAGDIVFRKNPLLVFKTIKDAIRSNISRAHDPYNTFRFLMDCSEEINTNSYFYFIPSVTGEIDARYSINSKKVREVMNLILERGHFIGVHGSWNSFNNPSLFQNELNRLRKKGYKIEEGRQHYLKFENPLTWEIWNSNELKRDSSMGFYNRNGFRCGICYEFPVFNVIQRIKMNLMEEPLTFMENPFLLKKFTKSQCLEELKGLSNTVKQYEGDFVFLWHPNNFNNEWAQYGKDYKQYLDIIK